MNIAKKGKLSYWSGIGLVFLTLYKLSAAEVVKPGDIPVYKASSGEEKKQSLERENHFYEFEEAEVFNGTTGREKGWFLFSNYHRSGGAALRMFQENIGKRHETVSYHTKKAFPPGKYKVFLRFFWNMIAPNPEDRNRLLVTLNGTSAEISYPKYKRDRWLEVMIETKKEGNILEVKALSAPLIGVGDPEDVDEKTPMIEFDAVLVTDDLRCEIREVGGGMNAIYLGEREILRANALNLPDPEKEKAILAAKEKFYNRAYHNYLEDSSFETGYTSHHWAHKGEWGDQATAKLTSESLDSSTAAHGKKCATLIPTERRGELYGALYSKFHIVKGGNVHTLSLYLKADKTETPVTFGLLGPLDPGTKWQKHAPVEGWSKTVKATNSWGRFHITGLLPEVRDATFAVFVKANAQVRVDALQFNQGELIDYRPRQPIEVGISSTNFGNVYYKKENPAMILSVYRDDVSKAAEHEIKVGFYNLSDEKVEERILKLQFPKGQNHIQQPLPLYADKWGIYRVLADVEGGNSPAEKQYSVLPESKHLNEKYYAGSLGTHYPRLTPEQLAIFKKANFNWMHDKYSFRCSELQRKITKLGLKNTEELKAEHFPELGWLQQMKMCFSVQLFGYTNPQNLPKEPRSSEWDPEKERQYLSGWRDYVRTAVNLTKGAADFYEIENEPIFEWASRPLAHIIREACIEIKKQAPTTPAGAFQWHETAYIEDAIKEMGGPQYIDVFCIHQYGASRRDFWECLVELRKKYNKPAWGTEGGGSVQTMFVTPPASGCLDDPDILNKQTQARVAKAAGQLRDYLDCIGPIGLSKYIHYATWFGTALWPANCTTCQGGMDNIDYDGSLKATAVGQACASHLMDESSFYKLFEKDPLVYAFVMKKNEGGSFAPIWSNRGEDLSLIVSKELYGKILVLDWFTNPIEGKPEKTDYVLSLAGNGLPLYLESRGNPEELSAMLNQIQIRPDLDRFVILYQSESNQPVTRVYLANGLAGKVDIEVERGDVSSVLFEGNPLVKIPGVGAGQRIAADFPMKKMQERMPIRLNFRNSEGLNNSLTKVLNSAAVSSLGREFKLDGDLSDWNSLTPVEVKYYPDVPAFGQRTIRKGYGFYFGHHDLKAEVYMGRKDDNLVFAFRVQDDVIKDSEKIEPGKRDLVEISLDPRFPEQAIASEAQHFSGYTIHFAPSSNQAGAVAALITPDGQSIDLECAGKKVTGVKAKNIEGPFPGYNGEVLVPLKLFGMNVNLLSSRPWGMEISLHDSDGAMDRPETELLWAGGDYNYGDPRGFGVLFWGKGE